MVSNYFQMTEEGCGTLTVLGGFLGGAEGLSEHGMAPYMLAVILSELVFLELLPSLGTGGLSPVPFDEAAAAAAAAAACLLCSELKPLGTEKENFRYKRAIFMQLS